MVCIFCTGKTKTINSRPNKRRQQTWRRHQCLVCKRVWSTYETPDYATVYVVQSSDGVMQAFDRDRLFISLYKSCQHRVAAAQDASELCGTVLAKLGQIQTDGLIYTEALATLIHDVLQRFDTAAAVHYAAFHKVS